ncbi:hypothetical protein AAMO2058_000780200 [Amorphochlora amoebiformis]|uniref:peptidylprolyl isomerase n=1 Tax=Amorphochlora amoebiformis TaxID=1561963 RepID=A0A7S0D3X7_9EUKA|mmetsp:Transcript_18826/g.29948  ORF Transcript_18826/g.29948 Transcript_18826/m.29948 type:complete len:226 (+) Transcript_18826:23-700(+)
MATLPLALSFLSTAFSHPGPSQGIRSPVSASMSLGSLGRANFRRFRSQRDAAVKCARVKSDTEIRKGDTVSLDYKIKNVNGDVMQESKITGPMTFEVGVGETVQNPLFQGIDEEVIGLRLGDTKILNMTGPPWDPQLMFKVPRDHPEITRLEGRYRSQGGIQKGEYVELVNGQTAMVYEIDVLNDIVTLDCNSAFAGNSLSIEFAVVDLEMGDGKPKAYRPFQKV